MPVKKTTKISSKTFKDSEKEITLKVLSKKDKEKDVKKVVVKRRKVELKPTKASAVAIASQANRAKKQALIERVSNSDIPTKQVSSSDTKIPVWVWVFFGCSLMLFCISFYQAIIRPQIEIENVVIDDSIYGVGGNVVDDVETQEIDNGETVAKDNLEQGENGNKGITVPETATDVIKEFFSRLSSRDFDSAFDLMIPALRNYNDIRAHFKSFRMDPFLDGVEGGNLTPENFRYVNSPSYGKDVYNFDLSYVLKSNQEKYDETWEFTVNTQQGNPLISSIRCISSKCSYHPIFWPENFGLMK